MIASWMRPAEAPAMRLRFGIAAAILLSAAALALSWNLPLLEFHSFRQTQTAISSYWMWGSPHWLAYPTPVLGYPWSIPFELPVYQAIAMALASTLPISLDQSGRLVSWLFAIATIFPLRYCLREITGRERLADIAALLFLLSPLYMFGARAFMIESTALFLAVCFLAATIGYWRAPTRTGFAWLLATACLAALVKVTTLFGFGLAALLYLAPRMFGERQAWRSRGFALRYLPIAVAVLTALLLTLAYVHFGDVEKARTLWGGQLGSKNLATWNYGTWAQKTDPAFWNDIVFGRASRELLGDTLLAWIALGTVAVLGRGLRLFALALLALYLVPFFVFANLHHVHNYYQLANGIFLVVLVACGCEAVRERGGHWLGLAAAAAVTAVMLFGFHRDFLPKIVTPRINQRTVELANFARSHTVPDEVILGFGLAWSSEVPYYATRRAMLMTDFTKAEVLRHMRARPADYLGQHRLGLVVVCPNGIEQHAEVVADYRALVESVIAGRKRYRISDCDVYR